MLLQSLWMLNYCCSSTGNLGGTLVYTIICSNAAGWPPWLTVQAGPVKQTRKCLESLPSWSYWNSNQMYQWCAKSGELECNRTQPEMKHPFLKSSSNEAKRRDQQQWLMAAMLSERDVPLLQRTDEKCTWEKKGKDHFSWSALLLANSQGQAAKVLLFTFLTWGWGRKGEGRSEVRASAGPPGTPLPGGRKSMWFLSYLWEGLSAASKRWHSVSSKAEEESRHWRWKRFDSTPTAAISFTHSTIAASTCAHVPICRRRHARWTASARHHGSRSRGAVKSMQPVGGKAP